MSNISDNNRDFRDIWSYGGSARLSELLSSSLATLLLLRSSKPTYLASPWITDFTLYNNQFRAYSALFPALADEARITLSKYIARLSEISEVRIMTTKSRRSREFLQIHTLNRPNISHRIVSDLIHEKGILAQSFYIEGSMNLTHRGARVNGEKVTYFVGSTAVGADKIARAYLEFDRRWDNLR